MALVVAATVLAAPSTSAGEPEALRYRWHLGGFFGTFARMFLPGHGTGELTTSRTEEGATTVQLDITAPEAEGQFWRYGSEIDSDSGRTLRAWSSYRFRGKEDAKESILEEDAVIDIASGILLLRHDPPTEPRPMRIWNDGKIYPVVIQPRGPVIRRVEGRPTVVRHFAIRPRRVPGERMWKGEMDIFLANDEAATPVEISVERSMARVRLMIDRDEADE